MSVSDAPDKHEYEAAFGAATAALDEASAALMRAREAMKTLETLANQCVSAAAQECARLIEEGGDPLELAHARIAESDAEIVATGVDRALDEVRWAVDHVGAADLTRRPGGMQKT